MYAAIRQGKAKAGMAEELARRIKEGAIPIISDVPGFKAYYVIYAPDEWGGRLLAEDHSMHGCICDGQFCDGETKNPDANQVARFG
jgi:hypothetical protein